MREFSHRSLWAILYLQRCFILSKHTVGSALSAEFRNCSDNQIQTMDLPLPTIFVVKNDRNSSDIICGCMLGSHPNDLGSISGWWLEYWEWDDNALKAVLHESSCRTCKKEQASIKSQDYFWKLRSNYNFKYFMFKYVINYLLIFSGMICPATCPTTKRIPSL